MSCRRIQISLLNAMGLLLVAGCQEVSSTPSTLQERVLASLVGIPFLLASIIGNLIGRSANQFLAGWLAFFGIILLVQNILSIKQELPPSADLNLRVFGMAGFWVLMGGYVGYQASKYLHSVGPRGISIHRWDQVPWSLSQRNSYRISTNATSAR